MLIDRLNQECHVWFVNPDRDYAAAALDRCESVLSARELARCRRLRFAADRRRYLVSHAMVRQVLSRYARPQPQDWLFEHSARGKPEIANPSVPPLRFNLTHTRELAACIVAMDVDCGIDAEYIKPRHDPDAVARRMFSARECTHLASLEGRPRLAWFYRQWTLREAYVKAIGVGIAFPTRRLTFSLDSAQPVEVDFDEGLEGDTEDWQFDIPEVSASHALAIAVRSAGTRRRIVVHPFEL